MLTAEIAAAVLAVAAIAIRCALVAAWREEERRRTEEQERAWEAVRAAAAQERRIARLGMRG